MKKRLAWLLCLAWMALIFTMSATPADISSEESGAVTGLLARVLGALFAGFDVDLVLLEKLVRKAAHMAEYAVLFLLYRRALRLSGAKRAAWAALWLCALYGATDEFHQLFVPGRTGKPVDVLIDTGGAALAWCAASCFGALRARLRRRA